MMIHPGYEDVVNPTFTTIEQYTVEYFGKDAHAAGAPDQGINALPQVISLDQSNAALLLLHVQHEGSDGCQT